MAKNIFIIIGSASKNSSNHKLIEHLQTIGKSDFSFEVFGDLKTLPHFDPELSNSNPPREVMEFIGHVEKADGVLICTPEYIFSIPSGLKNALEWCVATTVFSEKPTGLITASAHGQKGSEELQLIMKTLSAKFVPETILLVQGVKGKINMEGKITNDQLESDLEKFMKAYKNLITSNGNR